MTTKDQERQAIEKIRKIVEGLGENSYVGFAMDGQVCGCDGQSDGDGPDETG